jgi:hypothetical protein
MKDFTSSLRLNLAPGLILALVLQSCYHYRVSSTNFDPGTEYQRKTVHSYFWGAVQKRDNGIDVVTANCDAVKINKIDEVRVTTNIGYALITVATLGIWCPMQIEWKCAKPCTTVGEIGGTNPDGAQIQKPNDHQ